jgi:hypothetical protein
LTSKPFQEFEIEEIMSSQEVNKSCSSKDPDPDAALFIEARLPQATWAAWKSSPVLQPLRSRAQEAMALGAQDLLGDERFDAADFYLANAKLPEFQAHEDRVQLDWEQAEVAVVCVCLV